MKKKDGAVKIWIEEEIRVNCEYEEGQDYIQAILVFPKSALSVAYIDSLQSHPEISKVDEGPDNLLGIQVTVEKSMPFELMVRKCLGVIAGALYVRIPK